MDDAPLTSRAHVATDRADRYAKQLAAHLARRLETAWDETTGRGVVHLDGGRCDLERDDSGLSLHAAVDAALAPAEQTAVVARIEDVVGRHLVRFGARDELVVTWQRSDGSPGGVFQHTDGPEAGHER
ncbi:MAG: DUF2218 domain-containing protein [Lapillicoccus sp.]